MFAPHPSGLLALWEHWADEERDELEREESEQRAAVDEFRDAAHWWFWQGLKENGNGRLGRIGAAA